VASPYFTPYMLRELEFTYGVYMTLVGAAFGAKVVALMFLGKLARRFGAGALLRIGTAAAAVVPFLWLFGASYPYLFVLQLFAGVAWATFEFAAFLLYFDTIREEERTSLLTTMNVANASAMVAGSLLGGALLEAFGSGTTAYHVIFALSGATRLLILAGLAGVALRRVPVPRVVFRTVALRDSLGSIARPILATLFPSRRGEGERPSAKPNDPPHS